MQSILIIAHAPPYGNERLLSALRLASALIGQEHETLQLRLFMMSDAVTVALPGHASADLAGGLEAMLEGLINRGVPVHLCRTCANARGLADLQLIQGVTIATIAELADWTLAADKVITF